MVYLLRQLAAPPVPLQSTPVTFDLVPVPGEERESLPSWLQSGKKDFLLMSACAIFVIKRICLLTFRLDSYIKGLQTDTQGYWVRRGRQNNGQVSVAAVLDARTEPEREEWRPSAVATAEAAAEAAGWSRSGSLESRPTLLL